MKHKKIRKQDIFLVAAILLIAGVFFVYTWYLRQNSADTVTVKVDGAVTGTYSLHKDQTIQINGGTNVLETSGGKARMKEADCPDQICVRHKAISADGESIICLPNKVVVEVKAKEQGEYDAVSN